LTPRHSAPLAAGTTSRTPEAGRSRRRVCSPRTSCRCLRRSPGARCPPLTQRPRRACAGAGYSLPLQASAAAAAAGPPSGLLGLGRPQRTYSMSAAGAAPAAAGQGYTFEDAAAAAVAAAAAAAAAEASSELAPAAHAPLLELQLPRHVGAGKGTLASLQSALLSPGGPLPAGVPVAGRRHVGARARAPWLSCWRGSSGGRAARGSAAAAAAAAAAALEGAGRRTHPWGP